MPEENASSPPTFSAEGTPTLQQLVDYLVEQLSKPERLKRVETTIMNGIAKGGSIGEGALVSAIKPLVEFAAVPIFHVIIKVLLGVLGSVEPITSDVAKLALDAVLGDGPGRAGVPAGVGQKILEKLAPVGGVVEPGTESAAHYMDVIVNLQMETWLLGFVAEVFGDAIDLERGAGATMRTVAELRDVITQVFGGGRITRRVLAPFIDDGIVTPAKWATSKRYRPTLLSPADAIRQFLRGHWTNEQMREELARQGWSEDRIEALVNGQRKFFGAGDVRIFQTRGHWTKDRALQHLVDQGYTQDEAEDVLRLEGLRRIESLESTEASTIIAAYVARDIELPEFDALMGRYVKVDTERALLSELAELRRGLVTKRLSPVEVKRLVTKGILSVVDYRRALEADSYGFSAIDALELELRQELAADRTLEQHKADQAEAAAAAKQAAADAKAAREAELAQRNALPTLQEYRRAYVRGLLPREQLAAAITREKIAITGDDLALLLADADADRAAHLEQLDRRAAADAKKPDPQLPLATIEASVLRGILDLDQYARELAHRGFDAEESAIAVALLRDRLAQQQEAADQKAAAAKRAELAGVSLPTWERAVRLGVRTLDQYAAFLAQLQTPDVAKALILDLLRQQLADDQAARVARTAREAAAAANGISLAQRRRAVIAGVQPRAYYEAALRAANWPVEDQRVELALVDAELAAAAEARATRDHVAQRQEAARLARAAAAAEKAVKAAEPPPPPELSLAQLERAVKLGLLAPAVMRDALYADGYSAGDVETIVGLVVAGIPDARTAVTRETAIAADLATKNIALADLQRAVLSGLRTLTQYGDELRGRGYGEDDVALLVQLLDDRVALEQQKLRTAIAARLAKLPAAPPLAEILAAVDAGDVSVDQLATILQGFGVDETTALLFARMQLVFGGA